MRRILFLALLATSISCSSLLPGRHVRVRFQNTSTIALTNLTLSWPRDELRSDALAPGAVSAYEEHDGAYHYGTLSVTANGTVRRLQAIDFVGESPLDPGSYTFLIRVPADATGQVDLQLIEEK